MLLSIDDINENLNRETTKNQAGKSGIEIGFMDVNQMSGPTKALYLMGIISSIGALMYFFYEKMVLAPESEELERQKKYE